MPTHTTSRCTKWNMHHTVVYCHGAYEQLIRLEQALCKHPTSVCAHMCKPLRTHDTSQTNTPKKRLHTTGASRVRANTSWLSAGTRSYYGPHPGEALRVYFFSSCACGFIVSTGDIRCNLRKGSMRHSYVTVMLVRQQRRSHGLHVP